MQSIPTGTTQPVLAESGVTSNLSPYSPAITETLHNILAPGRRARLSPFVEAAQFAVLFGQRPTPKDRHTHARQILAEHQTDIAQLAYCWTQFAVQQGKSFQSEIYNEEFLRAYLAYYLTVNVCKIQLTMLEMVRQEKLEGAPTLIDVGVGAGTTVVAVLDFMIAWANVCDLYDVHFPVTGLQLVGYDCNPHCLDFAKQVSLAYASSLSERQWASGHRSESPILSKVQEWIQQATWQPADLTHAPLPVPQNRAILIASNVMNEVDDKGKDNLGRTIANLPVNSLALIIEPGDSAKTQALNRWRHGLLSSCHGIIALAPCCEDDPVQVSSPCCKCWNARRESLHQSLLYKQFRREAVKLAPDSRQFDDFENELLSWSYVWLERSDQLSSGGHVAVSGNHRFRTRFLGLFHQRKVDDSRDKTRKNKYDVEVLPHAADRRATGEDWQQYAKLCPIGHADRPAVLVLERSSGYELPALQHGEPIWIEGAENQPDWNGFPRAINIVPGEATRVDSAGEQTRPINAFLLGYSDATRRAIDEIAYRLFGFSEMRPFQHDILEHVLTGRSILGIAATGGGKSECFILPAMLLPGITVVISPLKSLMQDQYDQRICERYGLNNLVAYINGDVPFPQRQTHLKRLELGYYKLIYLTPEQLGRDYVLASLRRADERIGIRYLALDEAHCISQWGHDFRSSYLNMVRRLKHWGINPIRIALTATASPDVRRDLCEELELNPAPTANGGDVYIHSSNRPELNLVVRLKNTTAEKADGIVDDLRRLIRENAGDGRPGAAIVFMPHTGGDPNQTWQYWDPRKDSSERGRLSAGVVPFASYLERALQRRVCIFHGQMNSDDLVGAEPPEPNSGGRSSDDAALPDVELGDLSERHRRSEQQAFIAGDQDIMVATKGFGMGIDKPNIRLAIHRTPPGNLEAYAQEAGRAGRDGDVATAVLYYSPDKPADSNSQAAQSDHEIQTFFLRERYIRREDVLVMRAFLKQLPCRGGEYLYFTNDEAIEFFSHCTDDGWQSAGLQAPYTWPRFETRRSRSRETAEHKSILDRGHLYEKRTGYLERILQVLYRIRPTLGQQPFVAFLNEFQRTGIQIKNLRSMNINALWQSNAYFGQLLREHFDQDDKDTLRRCLNECATVNVLDFARRLDLSPSEAVSMLYDMRLADGHFIERYGKQTWQPTLIDFSSIVAPKYGPARDSDTPEAWLAYAGATGRTKNKTVWQAANVNGVAAISLRAMFPPDTWSRSVGWEVLPGPAFLQDNQFSVYLDAFMALHDQREANDREAYRRLLTDYVGADENGKLRSRHERRCLRSVLLGYLETNEVVVGDTCYSCSRCVPNEQFELDPDKRRQVVTSLSQAVQHQLETLKLRADKLPTEQEIDSFWQLVAGEQEAGKSVIGYVTGWSSRQLLDTPGHRAARWLRVTGMLRQTIPLQPKELVDNLRQLTVACATYELEFLLAALEQAQTLLPESKANLLLVQAHVYHRLEQFDMEQRVLQQVLVTAAGSNEICYQAHVSLAMLQGPAGVLSNAAEYLQNTLLAARTAADSARSLSHYAVLLSSWSWAQLRDELDWLEAQPQRRKLIAELLLRWVEANAHSQELATLFAYLAENNRWQTIADKPTLLQILRSVPTAVLAEQSALAVIFFNHQAETPGAAAPTLDAAEVMTRLTLAGYELNSNARRLAAQTVMRAPFTQLAAYQQQYVASKAVRVKLFQNLFREYKPTDFAEMLRWLTWFDPYISDETIVPVFNDVLKHSQPPGGILHGPSLEASVRVLCLLLHRPRLQETAHKSFLSVAGELRQEIADYCTACLSVDPPLVAMADAALARLLQLKNCSDLVAGLDHLEQTVKAGKHEGKSERIDSILRLRGLLSELAPTFGTSEKLEPHHFEQVLHICRAKESIDGADMAVAVLEELRRRQNPGWLTPISFCLQALGYARRFDEAAILVQLYRELTVGPKSRAIPALQFLKQIPGEKRSSPPYAGDYRRVAACNISHWL